MESKPHTLPDGYYLKNLEALVNYVEDLYGDLLEEGECALIAMSS